MGEKAEHSMTIFISYGHPDADICRRIVERLRERGHTVWFDESNLHHGENWRRGIAEGIVKSQGVVSCMSKHSVRDPGVCLDELSIAVGVQGGNIFPVLLESEREVRPPASICHLQWVNMSEWKQLWGTPDFEPWFDACMAQIIERVESPESVRFAGEIDQLKRRLTVDHPTGKQRSLLSEAFVGREWLVDEVYDWLNDPNGAPLCVLYGDPGVGKSAFAARFSHYNQAVAACLFLECEQPHYRDARSVIMTLAYLLACRIVDYRQALLKALEGLDLSRLNEFALFERLIAEPARASIDGEREMMCIVIDGLDESSGAEKNALATVLKGDYVRRLPRWLRILVTSREVTEVMAPLAGAFHLTLHGSEERNKADIRAYFTEMLGERFGGDPAWPAALDTLVERSDGIFLYAKLVVDGMRNEHMGINDIAKFPQGLSAAFYHWFEWFFPDPDEFDRKFRLPLGMILASPEPLPRDELMRTLDWSETEQDKFIQRIRVLLLQDTDDFGQATIRFSHQYLIQWLCADISTHPYAVSQRDAIAAMARAFYECFKEGPEDLTFYEALHLADYLRQSRKKALAHEAETNHALLWRILAAGDHCNTWGKLDHALACFRQGRAMAEAMCAESDELENRRDLGASCNRTADILRAQGKLDEALALYEIALAIFEQLVRERGTLGARSELSTSYIPVADILGAQGKLDEALVLYEKALAINEQLVQERNTPGDRRDLSVSYDRVAGILEAQEKTVEAIVLYEKALTIREQLVQERGTPDDRRDLGVSYVKVAGILEAWGKTDDALTLYEKSLANFEQLVQEYDMLVDRRDLSFSYGKVADILEAQKKLGEALALYEKSLAISEQLVRERGTAEDCGHLSIGYNQVADILEAQGKFDEALEMYEKGLAIAEQLVRERGTSNDRYNLSVNYKRIAGVLNAQGNPDEALTLLEKSIAISEQLVRERGTPSDHRGLSDSYSQVADILEAQGKPDEVLALYEKSLAFAEQLVRERGTPDDRWDLSVSYEKIADILNEQGNLDEALTLLEKSIAIREQLVHERGTPGDFNGGLSISYYKVANILEEQERLDEALAFYRKFFAIREQIVDDRGTADDRSDLSVSYDQVAISLEAEEKLDEALALYEKSLAIREQIVRERGTPKDRSNLSFSYENVADILEAQEKLDEALVFYKKSLAIHEQLVRERDTAEDRSDLSVSCKNVADILKAQGKTDEALALYEKDLAIREQLVQERGSLQDWDDLVEILYTILHMPNLPRKTQLSHAQRGLEIAQKLLAQQPSDRYRIKVAFFKSKSRRGLFDFFRRK